MKKQQFQGGSAFHHLWRATARAKGAPASSEAGCVFMMETMSGTFGALWIEAGVAVKKKNKKQKNSRSSQYVAG